MAMCKFCGVAFQWGRVDDRWVPLVPVGQEDGLERGFQDEDGALRAAHRLVCVDHGGGAIRAVRLPRPVPASALAGDWSKPDADGVIHHVAEDRPLIVEKDAPVHKKRKKRRGESSPIGDDDGIPF